MTPHLSSSIILPIYNESDTLDSLIQTILKQMDTTDELIIVNAGSTDDSSIILEKYQSYSSIVLIEVERAYPGKARNLAIEKSKNSIIIQIDGGCHPSSHWLQEIKEPLKDASIDYVVGNIKVLPIIKKIGPFFIDFSIFYAAILFTLTRSSSQKSSIQGGASVAYRKWIWTRVNGFPNWKREGEDLLFALKAQSLNLSVTFNEKAILFWELGPKFTQILKRLMIYQKNQVLYPRFILKSHGGVINPLILGIVSISFIWIHTWIQPTLIFSYLGYRSIKTYRKMKLHFHEQLNQIPAWMTGLLIFVLELIKLPCRWLGLLIGFYHWPKFQLHEKAKIKHYLNS